MRKEHDQLSGGAPRQTVPYPGESNQLSPHPHDEMRRWSGSGLLYGRRALITGGDSGIGRAVAAAFAKEGADVAITYLSEDDDAAHTLDLIEAAGRRGTAVRTDLADADECRRVVDHAVDRLGGLDILVNNAGTQTPVDDLADLSYGQWEHAFAVNVAAVFHTTKAALEHLTPGGSVINTGSVNGLRGNKKLIDYSAAKGAVHALTFSLAQALLERRIRVNCVALRAGLDTTDPGHLLRRSGGGLRRAGTIWAARTVRRDRTVVRLLRGGPPVLVLHRRGARHNRR